MKTANALIAFIYFEARSTSKIYEIRSVIISNSSVNYSITRTFRLKYVYLVCLTAVWRNPSSINENKTKQHEFQ